MSVSPVRICHGSFLLLHASLGTVNDLLVPSNPESIGTLVCSQVDKGVLSLDDTAIAEGVDAVDARTTTAPLDALPLGLEQGVEGDVVGGAGDEVAFHDVPVDTALVPVEFEPDGVALAVHAFHLASLADLVFHLDATAGGSFVTLFLGVGERGEVEVFAAVG